MSSCPLYNLIFVFVPLLTIATPHLKVKESPPLRDNSHENASSGEAMTDPVQDLRDKIANLGHAVCVSVMCCTGCIQYT